LTNLAAVQLQWLPCVACVAFCAVTASTVPLLRATQDAKPPIITLVLQRASWQIREFSYKTCSLRRKIFRQGS